MKKLFQCTLTVLFLSALFACNNKVVFEQYQHIPEKNWHKDSVLNFTITVDDTVKNNNFLINVRNDVNYKYSNLWLFLQIEQPDGKTIDDKFEIVLADPSGKWLGSGFSGLKTRESVYRRNVFFPVSGEYKVRIQQGMRENNLKGISDIGIRIEAVE